MVMPDSPGQKVTAQCSSDARDMLNCVCLWSSKNHNKAGSTSFCHQRISNRFSSGWLPSLSHWTLKQIKWGPK